MRNYRIQRDQPEPDDDEDDEDDLMNIRRQVQNEMATIGEERDEFGMQLERDLTQRAYEKISRRNKDLKLALIAARDKVRELKAEKRSWKRQYKQLQRDSLRMSNQTPTSMQSSELSDLEEDIDEFLKED